jgi:hypothetical protein
MGTTLRAEFFVDDEAHNWHYRVPALHINGGRAATCDEATRQCLEAVVFALDGDPSDFDSDAHAVALQVSVTSAA